MRRLTVFSLLLGLALGFWIAPATAQVSQGTIRGLALDAQEGRVADVTITATEQDTGLGRTATSASDGSYVIPDLRPGVYTIRAERRGFAVLLLPDVVVNVGSTAEVVLPLRVAAVTETVTVSAAAPPVSTVESKIAGIVEEPTIQSLPLNGRNYLELSFLIPGNAPTANFDPTKARVVEVSSAGQLGRGGNVSVDGVDNTDEVVGGVLQNLSVDAVQEFQIVTNRFSAEFGRSGSSAINVITRSGTNTRHGSLSLFHRSDALQAANPIVAESGGFDRQQIAGTFGGPLRHDRAFVFGSIEYTNEDGAAVAARRNTATRTIDSIFGPAPLNDTMLTIRTDLQASPHNYLFGRYNLQDNDQTAQALLARPTADVSNLQVGRNRIHEGLFGWSRVISPTMVNALRVQASHFRNTVDPIGGPENRGCTPVSPCPSIWFPTIMVGRTYLAPQATTLTRWQIKDDVNWSRGNHALKFGLDLQPRIAADTQIDFYGGQGTIVAAEDFASTDLDGNGVIDDFDIPVEFVVRNTAPAIPTIHLPPNRYVAVYAQDDWAWRPNVTLNAGLRWEVDTNVNGRDFFSSSSALPANIFQPGERHVDANNVSPRLGAAWDLSHRGRTVVRGGYGLYYDRIVLNVSLLERLLNGPGGNLPIELILGNAADPAGASMRNPFSGPAAALPIGINVLSNDLVTPYVHQTSGGIQQAFGDRLVVSADYIRDLGRKFIMGKEVNLPRIAEPPVNPGISENVTMLGNFGRTQYDALLVSADWRSSGRFRWSAAYTLARAKNSASDDQLPTILPDDPLNLDREFSWAATDERHRLVVYGSWEAPFGLRVAPIVTVSSGVPFDIRTNTDFYGDGAPDRFPLLPRNAGGRSVTSGRELNEWIQRFNTDPQYEALRAARALQNGGNGGFDEVDPALDFTHPFRSVDVRVSRLFHLPGSQIELMLEAFNLFNTTNIRGFAVASYAGVADNMESSEFGKPLSTAGGIFGSGGPRAVQIGARWTF